MQFDQFSYDALARGSSNGSGGEARHGKTQGRRQQATGECKETGSESESKSTTSTAINTGRQLAQMLLLLLLLLLLLNLLLGRQDYK